MIRATCFFLPWAVGSVSLQPCAGRLRYRIPLRCISTTMFWLCILLASAPLTAAETCGESEHVSTLSVVRTQVGRAVQDDFEPSLRNSTLLN